MPVKYGAMTRAVAAVLLSLAFSVPELTWAGDVPAPTKPFDLRGATTYSAICVHKETGDVLGLRVFVRAPTSHPRIVVQFAEGGLGGPVAARAWTAAGRLYFTAPETASTPAVAGEVRKASVRLTKAYDGLRTLPLRNDLHGFPICE